MSELVRRVTVDVEALNDPTRAADLRSYFREEIETYGLAMPRARGRRRVELLGIISFIDVVSVQPDLIHSIKEMIAVELIEFEDSFYVS